jgi:hypothetical protein
MLLVESKEKLKELKERFEDIQLSLGTTALERELEEIDKKMAEGDFWSDGERAKSLTQRRKMLEENIKGHKKRGEVPTGCGGALGDHLRG